MKPILVDDIFKQLDRTDNRIARLESALLNFDGPGVLGPAGGVLSGSYPNPGFAVDMATQAELDAVPNAIIIAPASTARNTITPTGDFIPLTVQAPTTQILQRWNSGATTLSRINNDGSFEVLASGGTLRTVIEANQILFPRTSGISYIKQTGNQSLNLQTTNTDGVTLVTRLTVNAGDNPSLDTFGLRARPTTSATVPLTIRGASGQSVNLLEANINGGATIAGIDNAGRIFSSVRLSALSNTSGGDQIYIDNTNTVGRGEIVFQEAATTKAFFQFRGTTNGTMPNTFRLQSSTGTNADIIFGANGGNHIFIAGGQNGLTTGFVGVGTVTPGNKLELAAATSTTGGIGFGTDLALFRIGVGELQVRAGGAATATKLSIRALASQTANLTEWHDSGGIANAAIRSNGKFWTGGTTSASPAPQAAIVSTGTTAIGLIVQGIAAQSAALTEWQDSTGAMVARMNVSGGMELKSFSNVIRATGGAAAWQFLVGAESVARTWLGVDTIEYGDGTNARDVRTNRSGSGSWQIMGIGGATDTKLVVKGVAGQTVNLQEWQDSASSTVAYVDADGDIYSKGNRVSTTGDAAGGDLSGTYPNPQIASGVIVNADVNASAAIAYSKLNLATSIVNSDISASAAIVRSKLNFGSGLVNADIASSAAIARSKLDFGAGLVNADISASAAIAYSKLVLTNSIVTADLTDGLITAPKIGFIFGGGNRLYNSSFEAPAVTDSLGVVHTQWDGWTITNGSAAIVAYNATSTDAKRSIHGNQGLKITSTSSGNCYPLQTAPVPIQPDVDYCASAWIEAATAGKTLSCAIEWYDGAGALISTSTVFSATSTGAGLQRIIAPRITAPSTARAAKIKAYAVATAGSEVYYFDGFQLEAGQYPTTYAPRHDEILPGTINATLINAGAITAGAIQADAVNATHIDVTTLSAISADMGTITAGTITGALIRTEASGPRVELQGSTDSLRIYDASNELVRLDGVDGLSVFTPTSFSLKRSVTFIDASDVVGTLSAVKISTPFTGRMVKLIAHRASGDPEAYIEVGTSTGTPGLMTASPSVQMLGRSGSSSSQLDIGAYQSGSNSASIQLFIEPGSTNAYVQAQAGAGTLRTVKIIDGDGYSDFAIKLGTVTTASSQTSVTFDNINQSFRTLLLVATAKTTSAGVDTKQLRVRVNNNSAANYNSVGVQTTTTAGPTRVSGNNATSGFAGNIMAGNAPTDGKSLIRIEIPNYSVSGNDIVVKVETSTGIPTGEDCFDGMFRQYNITTPVTRIDLFDDASSAFANGCVFTLYGLP